MHIRTPSLFITIFGSPETQPDKGLPLIELPSRSAYMNYLAHAYLSFHDPHVTVGQMIADFVKGKQIALYPETIQRGIRLHRELDSFTDQHAATRAAKDIFRPECGPYGAVFMDIVYDHYLANDPERFTNDSLAAFSEATYQIIKTHDQFLPPFFRQVFTYMSSQNWLYHYRSRDGIYKSFTGLVRRAKYFNHGVEVPFRVFEVNYESLRACYTAFMPDAWAFMKSRE